MKRIIISHKVFFKTFVVFHLNDRFPMGIWNNMMLCLSIIFHWRKDSPLHCFELILSATIITLQVLHFAWGCAFEMSVWSAPLMTRSLTLLFRDFNIVTFSSSQSAFNCPAASLSIDKVCECIPVCVEVRLGMDYLYKINFSQNEV